VYSCVDVVEFIWCGCVCEGERERARARERECVGVKETDRDRERVFIHACVCVMRTHISDFVCGFTTFLTTRNVLNITTRNVFRRSHD